MNRLSAFLVTAALAPIGPAAAQVIDDWNTDGDGIISEDEWDAGLTEMGLFSDWDADGDGSLTSDEFAEGLFERFDDDGDGSLTAAASSSGSTTMTTAASSPTKPAGSAELAAFAEGVTFASRARMNRA